MLTLPQRHELRSIKFKVGVLVVSSIGLLPLARVVDLYAIPFNPVDCNATRCSSGSLLKKRRIFSRFEHQYKIIGMPRTQVIRLLGKPDENSHSHCYMCFPLSATAMTLSWSSL